ncbi:distal tail protein Dit [Marininema halotolerans]|uniref:Putative phage tail component, N-terminal domain-containing protein n=1 Tax=Marininema halotolerans TaxID=1155944 RepID=A0A1I6SG09_9BACL|nr:distal tail protein Dit [Marininema halotolerans]SFS75921.1 putative phage tail component, N-terminal domain-containing protein [Marininema halotolerans]
MGFTFAGIHSKQLGLKVMNITRSIAPGIRAKTVKVPGKAGVYDMGIEVDELQIPIEVLLMGKNALDIREQVRNLAAWLRQQQHLEELIFDDEPDKLYWARLVDETELDEIALSGKGTITFLIPDPLAYAIEDDTFTSSLNTLVFERKGTAPSQPIITIQGVSDGMESGFELSLNEQAMKYTGMLGEGETLVIDASSKTAYVIRVDQTKISALNGIDPLTFPVTDPLQENSLTVTPFGAATFTQMKIECGSCWY